MTSTLPRRPDPARALADRRQRTTRPDLRFEKRCCATAIRLAAMDEVGRGALAGPVSVGVVVVTPTIGRVPAGLRDSKLLTPAAREALVGPVRRWAREYAVGHASADEIDAIGIMSALRAAARRALAQLGRSGRRRPARRQPRLPQSRRLARLTRRPSRCCSRRRTPPAAAGARPDQGRPDLRRRWPGPACWPRPNGIGTWSTSRHCTRGTTSRSTRDTAPPNTSLRCGSTGPARCTGAAGGWTGSGGCIGDVDDEDLSDWKGEGYPT